MLRDYDGLLAELRCIITRWSSKKLSYMGRIQLVDWIFRGKFGYLIQSNIVPQSALQAIQSATYQFIRGAQREVTWMVKTKRQGGIGVCDYKLTQAVATVDRVCRMWEKKRIWSNWMCRRYEKEHPINLITQKQGDSSNWKTMLQQKEHIIKCANLGPQYTKSWLGKGRAMETRSKTQWRPYVRRARMMNLQRAFGPTKSAKLRSTYGELGGGIHQQRTG